MPEFLDKCLNICDTEGLVIPENTSIPSVFAQQRGAPERAEKKRLILLTPVPNRTNFISLLKEALADNHPFEYRRSPWGPTFLIRQDVIRVIIQVFDWIEGAYREELLDMLPYHVPELALRCWDIKTNQVDYRYLFRSREPVGMAYHQYEFDFMRTENDTDKYRYPSDESCPFCGHQAH